MLWISCSLGVIIKLFLFLCFCFYKCKKTLSIKIKCSDNTNVVAWILEIVFEILTSFYMYGIYETSHFITRIWLIKAFDNVHRIVNN